MQLPPNPDLASILSFLDELRRGAALGHVSRRRDVRPAAAVNVNVEDFLDECELLKGKGLDARDACQCCQDSATVGTSIGGVAIWQAFAELVSMAASGDLESEEGIYIVPQFVETPGRVILEPEIGTTPLRGFTLRTGRAVPAVGALFLVAINVIASIVGRTGALALVDPMSRIVDIGLRVARDTAKEACASCITTKLWKANPRYYVDPPGKIRTRIRRP